MGNITFDPYENVEKGEEGSRCKQTPVVDDQGEDVLDADGTPLTQLALVARLLGVSPSMLEVALTSRHMVTQRGSAYSIPLRVPDAEDARDALAAAVYTARGDQWGPNPRHHRRSNMPWLCVPVAERIRSHVMRAGIPIPDLHP